MDVHVDSDWAKGHERKSTSGGMMINIGGRVLRSCHGCSRGTWNAVDDGRLGRDHPRASLD